MTRLFRSKSGRLGGVSEINQQTRNVHGEKQEYGEEEHDKGYGGNDRISGNQSAIVDILVAVVRKSLLVSCSVERDDGSSMEISWPTEVRHVSHVTFDRFNGFLGLPAELQPEVSRRVPSASVSVFGVSAKSMQCCYDDRGNSVPTILLRMQKRLYSEGGLNAEGIFRVNAENSQEEYVREQLNKGFVPHGIDVHCLSGLIKAWFRELPTGVLDSLTPEQVMQCNTEDHCSRLVSLLPQTEAELLDWAINLMADVVQHEQHNKMNARNIAMVFAPNMTQMVDPLTALIHAVQVMNFLKTLILKTLRQREDVSSSSGFHDKKSEPHLLNSHKEPCGEQTPKPNGEEKFWGVQKKIGVETFEPNSDCSSPGMTEIRVSENRRGNDEYENADWLRLRNGVRRLCRHPVFHFSKQAKKAWA